MLADDVPERRAQQRGDAGEDVLGADEVDAERPPHGAARAVGCDDVAGAHGARGSGAHVAQPDLHAVGAGDEAGDLGAERHARRRPLAQAREQQRLDVVLGDAGDGDRAEHAALLAGGIADLERRAVGGTAQRLDVQHARIDVGPVARARRPRGPRPASAPSSAG